MSRKDSFIDEQGQPRPASTYEHNYGAGAVEGGYTDRADTSDADFDPLRDRYEDWKADFEAWRGSGAPAAPPASTTAPVADHRQGYTGGIGSGMGGAPIDPTPASAVQPEHGDQAFFDRYLAEQNETAAEAARRDFDRFRAWKAQRGS